MTELKTIAISDVGVSDRLRPLDAEHAKAIAKSVREIGLINPITVRKTPRATLAKYTLVAGLHRLEACKDCGHVEILAIVVEADQKNAEIIEIQENFFRNDLSKIDRAIFGERLREIWEEKTGRKINKLGGRPEKNGINLSQFFDEPLQEFVAKRLGVSKPAAKRLHRIATGLMPKLRDQLRKTELADNETKLLSLIRQGPDYQAKILAALETEPDLDKALSSVKSTTETVTSPQDVLISRFVMAWNGMDSATRNRALELIGLDSPES